MVVNELIYAKMTESCSIFTVCATKTIMRRQSKIQHKNNLLKIILFLDIWQIESLKIILFLYLLYGRLNCLSAFEHQWKILYLWILICYL